ncbi:DUF7848 domain-containing protein [Streptomyces sp. RPT161]|uniref:DUF7848 domain-containing protein n=1 Tax=Streptomyces sp. RPT161 TaxID=3015993 RepID=UPI0022B90537|nr:hypothetical protein [Streptomyces sp. RPT161]
MSVGKVVYRFVDHTITEHPDTDVTLEAQCLHCADESGPQTATEPVDIWCLRHAGRTGHAGFRRLRTSFAMVVRNEPG